MHAQSKPVSGRDEARRAARAIQHRYEIPASLRPDVPITMEENARIVCEKRYVQKIEGAPIETIEEMFWRVATVIAQAEATLEEACKWAPVFYELMASGCFMPNTPTFTGAGTLLGQLAACFVLKISDDMGGDPDGIFQTLRNAALIQQTGGGNGFAFSNLRHKGARVGSSDGVASGPVGFLKVYNAAFKMIAQGGTRRGANMAVLRVDHPDIREFITCKESEADITDFNISVGITDHFMQCVKDDKPFNLVAPHTKEVVETVQAREIWRLIVKHAHHNGEPGVLFLDAANRSNPVPELYVLEATNPCGEQWLGPFENCCLGSLNLARMIKVYSRTDVDGSPVRTFDWKKFRECIVKATRFLDNVVTVNAYVESVPELREAAMDCRRIGLGFMGLADMFYLTGVEYGSSVALSVIGDIAEFMRFHSMSESVRLAQERGPFRQIDKSIFSIHNMRWRPPMRSPRLGLDWAKLVHNIGDHGIRNAAVTTIAPTGTIATVAGCEGYGCEPVFALAYIRHMNDKGKDLELRYVSPIFMEALLALKKPAEFNEEIIQYIVENGSCIHLIDQGRLPESFRRFVVASDITPEQHVRMQAAAQRFIDNSISKTCNFPEGATEEDVERAYFLAWELGCKGLTVYVTGSRSIVVLETQKEKDRKEKDAKAAIEQSEPAKKLGAKEQSLQSGWTPELRSGLSAHFQGIWNVLVVRHYQTSPVRAALIEQDAKFLEALIKAGADPHCPHPETGATLIEEASASGWAKGVEVLQQFVDPLPSQLSQPLEGSTSDEEEIPATSARSIEELKKMDALRWSSEPSVKKSRELEQHFHKRKLGNATISVMFKERLPNEENMFVHWGYDAANGEPITCFVDGAAAGTEMCAVQQMMGITTAWGLSIPPSLSPTERLALLADQLTNLHGPNSVGLGPKKVCSMPHAFAKTMYSMINAKLNGQLPLAPGNSLFQSSKSERVAVAPPAVPPTRKTARGRDLCPSCGNLSLTRDGSCCSCNECGFSKC